MYRDQILNFNCIKITFISKLKYVFSPSFIIDISYSMYSSKSKLKPHRIFISSGHTLCCVQCTCCVSHLLVVRLCDLGLLLELLCHFIVLQPPCTGPSLSDQPHSFVLKILNNIQYILHVYQ